MERSRVGVAASVPEGALVTCLSPQIPAVRVRMNAPFDCEQRRRARLHRLPGINVTPPLITGSPLARAQPPGLADPMGAAASCRTGTSARSPAG